MTKLEYYLRKISCFFRIRFQGNKVERLQIYKTALELLNKRYTEEGIYFGFGLCYLVNAQNYIYKKHIPQSSSGIMYTKFPELYIHKPFKHGAFWFTSDLKRGYEIRKSILEKAINQLS